MDIKFIPTEELIPYDNNPRINGDAVDGVAASIREFGFQQPIVVDGNMVVIVGHTRLKAAKKLGLKVVPVIIADKLTPEQANAYRLADNNVKGTEMFRTVNDAYNSRTDIGYSSGDIADQISNGDFTMYSDSGGSAHGRGIYFATDYYDSSLYGNRGQNPKTLRAKITSDKVVSEGKISQEYSRALQRGDKLATACSQARGADARNLYALAKGHDVIKADYGSYVVVLNRRAMTVSSTVKNTKIGGSSW